MKKAFVVLSLMLFVGSVSTTVFASVNSNGAVYSVEFSSGVLPSVV